MCSLKETIMVLAQFYVIYLSLYLFKLIFYICYFYVQFIFFKIQRTFANSGHPSIHLYPHSLYSPTTSLPYQNPQEIPDAFCCSASRLRPKQPVIRLEHYYLWLRMMSSTLCTLQNHLIQSLQRFWTFRL